MTTQDTVAGLEGVGKAYGARQILDGLDFSIAAGSVVALLGPNGAGKSTLAGLVTGRLTPDAGRVTLFGRDPAHPEARARMGVMLQAAGLPDGLSVAETVALQASYYRRGLPVDEILDQAGLTALAPRRCDRLSGGEQRRVHFALAIAGAPDFLVLDEPTTGYDPEARRALWQLVRRKADAGTAVLLATHHLDEADALADRIAVIADGRLIADGPPSAIRARVAGFSLRVRTALSPDALQGLPAVTRVTPRGADTTLMSTDARATLQALFAADPDLRDFDVTGATLEDALADLLGPSTPGTGALS
jgi:ABC-2 type transport system ATP-binding protein